MYLSISEPDFWLYCLQLIPEINQYIKYNQNAKVKKIDPSVFFKVSKLKNLRTKALRRWHSCMFVLVCECKKKIIVKFFWSTKNKS